MRCLRRADRQGARCPPWAAATTTTSTRAPSCWRRPAARRPPPVRPAVRLGPPPTGTASTAALIWPPSTRRRHRGSPRWPPTRALFDRVDPVGLTFPAGRPPRCGRHLGARAADRATAHEGRGIEAAIDLSGALADPGASHRHAVLTRLHDGSYTVTDLGSTNGMTLNENQQTAVPGRPYPLVDGDRIHIGAWTTITVRRRAL